MNAIKYTVNIEIEVLDLDSVSALAAEVCSRLGGVHYDIAIQKTDGDQVKLTVKKDRVEI